MLNTWADDYDLVLEDVDAMRVELARQVLGDSGIPAFVEASLLRMESVGYAANVVPARLFVRKGDRERARKALAELGGPEELAALERTGAFDAGVAQDPPKPRSVRTRAWRTFALLLLVCAVGWIAWRLGSTR